MLRLFLSIILIGSCIAASGQSADIKVGDSVRVLKDKPLDGVEIDYFRKDEYLAYHKLYLLQGMPGSTYEIRKYKNGVIYLRIKEKELMMNSISPLKFKLYIDELLASGSIEIIKGK